MIKKMIDGFEGKMTTVKWAKICKCSHDTALRDIDDLINKRILNRSSKGGRSTAYELN
jgi:Fic family protein